jgi:hypothetical protein
MVIKIKVLLRIYLVREVKHNQETTNRIRAGILIGAKLWSKERLLERLMKVCCKAARRRTL